MRFGIGQSIARLEDQRLLLGQGQFTDDLATDNQGQSVLHAVFVRSPHAHARLGDIDIDAALSMPGVVAVFTGRDLLAAGAQPLPMRGGFKRPDGGPMLAPDRWPLAVDRVRHLGEAVAMVIAQSRSRAEDAAEAVMVEYLEEPAVASLEAATAPDALCVDERLSSNVCAVNRFGDARAVDQAFAQATHRVKASIRQQRVAPLALEPRACLASWEAASREAASWKAAGGESADGASTGEAALSGRVVLHDSTQNPSGVRQSLADSVLAAMPGSVGDKIRVLVHDVGGGFGNKTGLYPEEAAVVFACWQLKRSVKWRATRGEEFVASHAGRDALFEGELALDAEGKILALRGRIVGALGAYATTAAGAIHLVLAPKVVTGVYDVPQIDLHCSAVLTHQAVVSAYRGAGRPEAIQLIETLMDRAAQATGLDPAEIRRRNLIPASAMPYRSAIGERFDSGDFERLLDRALAASEWASFPARVAASHAKGLRRGRGLSCFLEWTGGNALSERVELSVLPTSDGQAGRVVLWTATQAMGQGLHTTYAQIVADRLGVAPEMIEFCQGDTDVVNGFGSMGSRSLFVGGSAVQGASIELERRGRSIAADALEVSASDLTYEAGRWQVAGTDLGIGLFEVAARAGERGLAVAETFNVDAMSWPNGCHVCEVEVDPETGSVRLDRFFAISDVGVVINPLIVEGQVHGGIVQAFGQAMMENLVYDASGQLLTGSLMDYAVPRANDLPFFVTETDETQPCTTNALGSKGVGELGTVGATPALVNAVLDALRPMGVRELQMPLSPQRVWEAIQAASPQVGS